jgi:predicted nucleic acid-binding protein
LAVVVDTGPLFAAAHVLDEAHELAAALVGFGGRDLLVPDPVIVECDTMLRRTAHETARRFLEAIAAGSYLRVTLSPSMLASAIAIDAQYRDLGLGLVDASVMAIAASTGAAILTFDFRDFRAAAPPTDGAWDLVVDEATYARAVRRRREP